MLKTMTRNHLSEFHLDEDFLEVVFLILKSRKFSPEAKTCFLDIVVERYETGIELLNSQIQSYNFICPKEFLENIPPPKKEEILLPLHLHIEDDCTFKYQTKDEVSRFNIEDKTNQLVIEGLEINIIHRSFIGIITDYMEDIFSPNFQTCTLYKDQTHQMFPLHTINLVMRTHNQFILLNFLTNNQVVHLFLLLLDWLH